jgi:uncharacterized peroxidase-related enzyme
VSEPIHSFTTEVPHWNPYVTPVDLAAATPEQLDALKVTPSNTKVSEYVLVLAHDPESLGHRSPLFNAIMYGRDGLSRAERELGAIGASIVNRCVYCVAVHASRHIALAKRPEVIEEIFAKETGAKLDDRDQAIFDFAASLSHTPSQASAEQVSALRAQGLDELEIVDLILSASIFGWANRLMHTLGEPMKRE